MSEWGYLSDVSFPFCCRAQVTLAAGGERARWASRRALKAHMRSKYLETLASLHAKVGRMGGGSWLGAVRDRWHRSRLRQALYAD